VTRRPRASAIIAGFLALQVVAPLSYYLWRDDPTDERFAWRMFSAVRVHSCSAAVSDRVQVDGGLRARPVDLRRVLHPAWETNLRRNRTRVIERFLRSRCDEPGVVGARFLRRCQAADGAELPPVDLIYDCAAAELRPRRVDP
jgi:hypothetical protein